MSALVSEQLVWLRQWRNCLSRTDVCLTHFLHLERGVTHTCHGALSHTLTIGVSHTPFGAQKEGEDLTYLTFLNPTQIQFESTTEPLCAAIHNHTPARTSHGAEGGYRQPSFGQ